MDKPPRRESERSRYYDLERYLSQLINGDAGPPMSLDDARQMADEACDNYRIVRIPVHGRPPQSAAAYVAYADLEKSSVHVTAADGTRFAVRLEFPEWSRRPLYILHQVTHYVLQVRHGRDSIPGRGTDFVEDADDEPDGCRFTPRPDGGWEYAYPPPPGLDGIRPFPTPLPEMGGND